MTVVPQALRSQRAAGIGVLVLLLVLATVVVVITRAGHGILPRISDIGAWLSNDSNGSVTHANGLSGEADSRVTVANAAGHPLSVVQDGNTVIVVDTVTGAVTRIDPAQLTVTQSVSYGSPHVQVVAGGGHAYAVDPARGLVQPIDLGTLSALGSPVSLRAPLGTAAVDQHGTVWVPELATGNVVPVTGSAPGVPVPVGAPGDALALTVARGAPVVTDATNATMTVLLAGGRQAVNLPAGSADLVAPAATDGVLVPVLSPATHRLVIVDTSTAQTTAVALTGFTDDRLGPPQVLGGRVYLPDNSTGRLIVYDASTGALLNQITVSGKPGRLELFLHDGLLWANDASGTAAVSIDSTGTARQISKYSPDLPGGPLPSSAASTGTGGGGTTTEPGPTGKPKPSPTAPPNAPTGVVERSDPGTIEVRFNPSSGATPTSYTLSGVPAGATVDPPSIGPGGPYLFTVTGLPCQQFPFAVVANYPSGPLSATGPGVFACLAPAAPANVTLDTGSQHQVTASWPATASTGGGPVTYQASLDGAAPVDVGTGLSKAFTALTNFQTYTVSVTARNPAGSSAPKSSGAKKLSAGPWNGVIGNNAVLSVNLRADHTTASASLRGFPPPGGQAVTVVCVYPNGGAWADPSGSPAGSSWYQVSSPQAGWVATGYVPNVSGVWQCS
jgi:hypothetical protein